MMGASSLCCLQRTVYTDISEKVRPWGQNSVVGLVQTMIAALGRKWFRRSGQGTAVTILVLLSTVLLLGCGLIGGGDAEASDTEGADGPLPTHVPTPAPLATPVPTPIPDPTATPTPTPVAQNPDEASNLLWVHLSRCVSLDLSQLEASMVKGDWFVRAASDSPKEYGFWKVEARGGVLEPHDNLARDWDTYVGSQCNSELFAPLSKPTPIPVTPTPEPATPAPPPDPVVTDLGHAVTTLWAHLVPCFSTLSIEVLEATWNPAENNWIVRTKADISPDYGVWTVAPDGSVAPQNNRSRLRDQDVLSGTC